MNATNYAKRLEKGVFVNVSLAGGKTACNRVWEDCGDVVFVCSGLQYDLLAQGLSAPSPIAFHRESVALKATEH